MAFDLNGRQKTNGRKRKVIHATACHEKFKNGVKYQWIVAWSPEIGHGDPVARKTATEIGHGNRH